MSTMKELQARCHTLEDALQRAYKRLVLLTDDPAFSNPEIDKVITEIQESMTNLDLLEKPDEEPKADHPDCPKLENLGSLITYDDKYGNTFLLGDLLVMEGKGVFDPILGKVDVTPEQAATHNRLMSEALIEGLDECPIGKGANFYFSKEKGVHTWIGTVVASTYTRHGSCIFFYREDKRFTAHLEEDSACIFVERIV